MIVAPECPPECLSQSGSFVGTIALNILGGILTVGVVELARWGWKTRSHRRFRIVLGSKLESMNLTLGRLFPPPGTVFGVDPKFSYRIKAGAIGSFCEVRGVAYIIRSIGEQSSIRVRVVPAQDIEDQLDLDFVAVGAMSNHKALDLFKNSANPWVAFSREKDAFVRKKDGAVIHRSRAGYDHGIIVKIHPVQFPERTWIMCAGLGEWGTSGAAYFLANHWRDLYRMLDGKDQPFFAVVEVEEGKDESAILLPELFEE